MELLKQCMILKAEKKIGALYAHEAICSLPSFTKDDVDMDVALHNNDLCSELSPEDKPPYGYWFLNNVSQSTFCTTMRLTFVPTCFVYWVDHFLFKTRISIKFGKPLITWNDLFVWRSLSFDPAEVDPKIQH